MRILIANAYNRHNAGDAALLGALIAQCREAFPATDIAFAGLEDPREYLQYEGAHNLGSIRRWAGEESVSRPRRATRKLLAATLAVLPRRGLRRLAADVPSRSLEPLEELRSIASADLVVGLGGGYLNGTQGVAGTLNVMFLLLPLWLAARLDRPTVLAPQSYGPFANAVQRRLVRHCLDRLDRIVVREDGSLALLRSLGVDDRRLERGVDGAFATGVRERERPAPEERASLSVGITARSWLGGEAQETYERAIAGFVDWLHDVRGAVVVLVPQVTSDYRDDDDRLVSRRVAAFCDTAPRVLEDRLGPDELRSVYANLDYLVGTRFHSVIFSLTGATPALAIEYEHKTSGIMRDLGLGEWVIPIGDVTTEMLRERFLALEVAAPEYRRHLELVLPSYVERARSFIDVLAASGR